MRERRSDGKSKQKGGCRPIKKDKWDSPGLHLLGALSQQKKKIRNECLARGGGKARGTKGRRSM